MQNTVRLSAICRWLFNEPDAVLGLLNSREELRLNADELRDLFEQLTDRIVLAVNQADAMGVRAARHAAERCVDDLANSDTIARALKDAIGEEGISDRRLACLEFLEFLQLGKTGPCT